MKRQETEILKALIEKKKKILVQKGKEILPEVEVKIPKKKGRPPKQSKALQQIQLASLVKEESERDQVGPRRCGRPRKKPANFDEEILSP